MGDGAGTWSGPYKVWQLIGEGGFGSVCTAEHERPVHRKGAIKLIKLGLDTRQAVVRFEQERQAPALSIGDRLGLFAQVCNAAQQNHRPAVPAKE